MYKITRWMFRADDTRAAHAKYNLVECVCDSCGERINKWDLPDDELKHYKKTAHYCTRCYWEYEGAGRYDGSLDQYIGREWPSLLGDFRAGDVHLYLGYSRWASKRDRLQVEVSLPGVTTAIRDREQALQIAEALREMAEWLQ